MLYWHVPVRVWALICRVLSGMKIRTLSPLMNNRHTISQKVIQCYSLIELIAPSQYKHCKTRTADTTPIKARVLLQVKTVAGNRRWCVRGVNCFSEANAGSGFRLFSCVPVSSCVAVFTLCTSYLLTYSLHGAESFLRS